MTQCLRASITCVFCLLLLADFCLYSVNRKMNKPLDEPTHKQVHTLTMHLEIAAIPKLNGYQSASPLPTSKWNVKVNETSCLIWPGTFLGRLREQIPQQNGAHTEECRPLRTLCCIPQTVTLAHEQSIVCPRAEHGNNMSSITLRYQQLSLSAHISSEYSFGFSGGWLQHRILLF